MKGRIKSAFWCVVGTQLVLMFGVGGAVAQTPAVEVKPLVAALGPSLYA